jgi:hypothetical protein
MNRKQILTIAGLSVAALLPSVALADVALGVSVGGYAPVYEAPAPVYYAAPPVYRDYGYERWREHEWREHQWREHEWREHEWREHYWR